MIKNAATSNPIALIGGMLIDGTGIDPLFDAVVIVNDGIIQDVGIKNRIQIPKDCTVFDIAGKTIMPGMIDSHVHISDLHPNIEKNMLLHRTVRMFKTAAMLKRTLLAGFTTIRDAGTLKDAGFRQAIELGLIQGPRLVLAGAIGQTGGHFDEYYPSGYSLPYFEIEICDGVPEVQKAARQLLRDGMDFIKVATTGGVVSPADSPHYTEWTMEELKAMVYEARARGKAVMAHACGTQGIKNAIRAGVWSVEHGSLMDEEAAQMLVDKGTFFVPTLYIIEDIKSRADEMGLPEVSKAKLNDIAGKNVQSFRMAVDAGAKIAAGSDIIDEGSHGKNACELAWLVHYGLTPMQAIVASTRTSAEACRIDRQVGTLQAGKLADLLVVEGNPLDDISILQHPERLELIMMGGNIIKS